MKRLSEATVLMPGMPQAEAWGFGIIGRSPTCQADDTHRPAKLTILIDLLGGRYQRLTINDKRRNQVGELASQLLKL